MQKIDSFTKEIKEEICSFNELTTSQEISLLSAYIRTNGSLVFKNLNEHLPFDLAILLLGIYPREMKSCIHTKTCMQML